MHVRSIEDVSELCHLELSSEVETFASNWWKRLESGPSALIVLALVGESAPPGLLLCRIHEQVLYCDYLDPGKVASPDLATYLLMGSLRTKGNKHQVARVVIDEEQCNNFGVNQALAVLGFNKAPQAHAQYPAETALEWVS